MFSYTTVPPPVAPTTFRTFFPPVDVWWFRSQIQSPPSSDQILPRSERHGTQTASASLVTHYTTTTCRIQRSVTARRPLIDESAGDESPGLLEDALCPVWLPFLIPQHTVDRRPGQAGGPGYLGDLLTAIDHPRDGSHLLRCHFDVAAWLAAAPALAPGAGFVMCQVTRNVTEEIGPAGAVSRPNLARY